MFCENDIRRPLRRYLTQISTLYVGCGQIENQKKLIRVKIKNKFRNLPFFGWTKKYLFKENKKNVKIDQCDIFGVQIVFW